ncbi:MAG: HAD-IA family hydrolase [Chloroflexi bacterium]|nr:HAD-IA family hydrolase [Chloroflexota bacterium]
MIKAVLFDMYGTLAGFSPSRYELQKRACEKFGLGDRVTPEGIVKGYARADAFMSNENARRPLRLRSGEERSRFFGEYERLVLEGCGITVTPERGWEIFEEIRKAPYGMKPFDDVVPALIRLRKRGLTLGLISNMNEDGKTLTDDLGLTGYLDFAVTSGEVGAEKPSPLIFQAALRKASVEAAETVVVGDQPSTDIEGALAVGMSAVLLDRDGNHPWYDRCPRIIVLDQLEAILDAG